MKFHYDNVIMSIAFEKGQQFPLTHRAEKRPIPMEAITSFIVAPQTVHLWSVSLAISDGYEKSLLSSLSMDEILRANRFRFAHHRKHYIAARGILRCILGDYLQEKAADICFEYSAQGKPYLPRADLQFNVSHSHERAVYAITKHAAIGVDIEKIETTYADAVAKRYFSESEYAQLLALPDAQRVQGFYAIWSRKEALVKAVGEGLSHPLSNFSVPIVPSITEAHLEFDGQSDWHLQSFFVDASYQAAFATCQTVLEVRYSAFPLARNS
jgi:4'-phosphopantetheinyl transferase